MKNQLENLFAYDNYRRFLGDYFQQQKRAKAFFSHRYFARKAGFSSPSFVSQVVGGARNLTPVALSKLTKALGLKGRSATYLEALVHFNQAESVEDRTHFLSQLEKLRRQSKLYRLNKNQFAYFDQWYFPVIRELAVHSGWGGNYHALGAMLRPPISQEKARHAMEILLDIGLLKKKPEGGYTQASETISVESIPVALRKNFRKEMLLRSIEAMENLGPEERHISGVTVAMSEQAYREVSALMDDLRKKVLEKAVESTEVDKVYQFNFHGFPLTGALQTSGGKDKAKE